MLLMAACTRMQSLFHGMLEHNRFLNALQDVSQTAPLLILLVVILVLMFGAASMYRRRATAQDYPSGPLQPTSINSAPCAKRETGLAARIAALQDPQSAASATFGSQAQVRTSNMHVSDGQPPHSSSSGPVQEQPGLPFLCPELVVPEASECVLVIPRLAFKASPTKCTMAEDQVITIDDARGVAVFRAKLTNDKGVLGTDPVAAELVGRITGGRTQDTRQLVLSSGAGDAVFAYCRLKRASTSSSSGSTIGVYHPSNALFGEVSAANAETGSYVVKTCTAWGPRSMILQGDNKLCNITATNESGRLLAITEPTTDGTMRRSVRIGPLVDAGFVVLSMLGIDMLENEEAEASTKNSLWAGYS